MYLKAVAKKDLTVAENRWCASVVYKQILVKRRRVKQDWAETAWAEKAERQGERRLNWSQASKKSTEAVLKDSFFQ